MYTHYSLSFIEISVLLVCAFLLGVFIIVVITGRRTYKRMVDESPIGSVTKELKELKIRYQNEIEYRDREIHILKSKFTNAQENYEIYQIEAEEVRKENNELKAELEEIHQKAASNQHLALPDYIDDLKTAQQKLAEHSYKIKALLEQIEDKTAPGEIQKIDLITDERLVQQIETLTARLKAKEKELKDIQKKEELSTEMNSTLDNAYIEFNTLNEKIKKLESQIENARKINIEYEELKESLQKIRNELNEQKQKTAASDSALDDLKDTLSETESKLKESNFDRQQLQKKIIYLEELNHDMQGIARANKRLEEQIKRIGELESMLNIVMEERDQLAKKTNQ